MLNLKLPRSVVMSAAQVAETRSAPATNGASTRLFRFGICTDVQYADLPQGTSHSGTARYYRDSLNALRRAVAAWRQRDVEWGIHLGDIIDGKNVEELREKALSDVLGEFGKLEKRVWHMIGNHCLYNFPRPQLNARLGIPAQPDGSSYYSFSPHPCFRCLVLDTYDISMLGWQHVDGHPKHAAAEQILDENNINEEKNSPDGMKGVARRFVKFGGGVSNTQLEWLQLELARASQQEQRVLVFSHQPFHPHSCTGTTLCWNYQEVMEILQQAGNVVASFCGHTHNDGFAQDEFGIHYRAFSAVLETLPGEDCYGFVDVFPDRLEVVGTGFESQTMIFPSERSQESALPIDSLLQS